MSDQLPPCPACGEAFSYEQGALLVCPMCGHEWSADEASDVDSVHAGAAVKDVAVGDATVKDSVGNVLADGDTVIVRDDRQGQGRRWRGHQSRHEVEQDRAHHRRRRRPRHRRKCPWFWSHAAQVECGQEGPLNAVRRWM